jgi:hypothetical protein
VRFMRRHIQVMPLLIWLLLFSTGAYALAQLGSTPAAPPVGLAGAASGYRVSHIVYAVSAADPRNIASVKFTITPSSANTRITTVRAKLIRSSASYSTCVNTPTKSQGWICPISGVRVAAADQLALDVGELPFGPGLQLYLPIIQR